MHKYFALLRLNFRAMLSALSFGRNNHKKKAVGGVGALLFLGALALYISITYSVLMMHMLADGLLEFYFPFMVLYCCVMALLLTAFAAGGLLFGGKDNDIMLALPVSAFSILLSRVLALYLENLLFCGLWMLPVCIVYAMQTGAVSVLYVTASLCVVFLVPLLPTLLGILFGLLTTWFSARFQRQSVFNTLISLLLCGILLVLALQMQRLPALLSADGERFSHILRIWLLPVWLVNQTLYEGSALALLAFLAVSIFPFLLVVWIISLRYKKLLTTLSTHRSRSNYKLSRVEAGSAFSALFKKEAGRYFGTSIYFVNTAVGLLILLGGCIYLCFARQKALAFLADSGLTGYLAPITAAAFCLILTTVCISCVSISLEGKTLWILKESPVPTQTLFAAKAALHVLVAAVPTLASLLLVCFAFRLSALGLLLIFACCLSLICHMALSGLICNLLLPKMDCANDAIVVKQSASVIVAMFGNMLLVGLAALLYLGVGSAIGFAAFALAWTGILILLCLLEWDWLRRRGVRALQRI